MARAEKVAAVAELTDRFKDSGSVVLTEYRGLSVTQLSLLREALGENATFSVVKNTLTKIAVNEAGLDDQLASLLSGPSAIAFVGGDVVEAAKGLRDFSRDNPTARRSRPARSPGWLTWSHAMFCSPSWPAP
jgi:large subunit ribosomal protein L10